MKKWHGADVKREGVSWRQAKSISSPLQKLQNAEECVLYASSRATGPPSPLLESLNRGMTLPSFDRSGLKRLASRVAASVMCPEYFFTRPSANPRPSGSASITVSYLGSLNRTAASVQKAVKSLASFVLRSTARCRFKNESWGVMMALTSRGESALDGHCWVRPALAGVAEEEEEEEEGKVECAHALI